MIDEDSFIYGKPPETRDLPPRTAISKVKCQSCSGVAVVAYKRKRATCFKCIDKRKREERERWKRR